MRKNITIIAAIIVLIGLGVTAYFFFFGTAPLSVSDTNNPFPSGTDTTTSGPSTINEETPTNTESTQGTTVAPRLVRITQGPVALGFIASNFTKTISLADASSTETTATAVSVRYVDRQSGNLYSYDASTRTATRVSNKTVPGVQEAVWTPDGGTAFLRYIAADSDGTMHVETYALPENGEGGRVLDRDINDVLVTGSTTLITLLPSSSNSVAISATTDGTSARTLFTSELSAITLRAGNPTFLIAYTKPSKELKGYLFLVNASSGAFTRLAGPLAALEGLPDPTGSRVLISYTDASGFHLAVINVTSKEITALPVTTLAEKCVWSSNGKSLYCAVPKDGFSNNMPDAWYRGTESFADRLWEVDFGARVASLIADLPTLNDSPVDAVGLTLDPRTTMLMFMNRIDGSLWTYSL